MKRFLLLTLLGTLSLSAAIKRGDQSAPPPPPTEQAAPKAENAPRRSRVPGSKLLEELLKRMPKEGNQLEFNEKDFENLLRGMLEEKGVPKDELKKLDLFGLLKMLREKTPKDGKSPLPFGLDQLGDLLGFQMDPKVAAKLDAHFKQLLDGSRPGTVQSAPATFILRDGQKENEMLALGTAVQANGWVLTKASEVEKVAKLQCKVNGAWVPAKVVRTWDEHDLALVKVQTKDLSIVPWATGPSPSVGTFITAVAPQGLDPVALGVVSVAARNLQVKGRGYLGVALDVDDQGLKISEVVPGGAALGAGIKKDDHVLEFDGQKADSVYSFTCMVSDRKAGEKVKLKLRRGNDVFEKEIQLGDRGAQPGLGRPGFDKMNGMGSTISKRKDNFPSVIQTDLPMEANQCGGPVTDLDGHVVGLVIARSGRIETLMIPSDTIRKTLDTVDFAKEEAALAKAEVKK